MPRFAPRRVLAAGDDEGGVVCAQGPSAPPTRAAFAGGGGAAEPKRAGRLTPRTAGDASPEDSPAPRVRGRVAASDAEDEDDEDEEDDDEEDEDDDDEAGGARVSSVPRDTDSASLETDETGLPVPST